MWRTIHRGLNEVQGMTALREPYPMACPPAPSWSNWCDGGNAGARRPLSAPLLRRGTQRSWGPREFQVLPGVGDPRTVDLQDGDVAVQEISNIGVGAVGREGYALREPAKLDFVSDPSDLLAVDLEYHGGAVLVVVESLLVRIGAAQQERQCKVAFWTNGEALRRIAHHHVIDHPWWSLLEVDHADCVDASVGAASCTVVCDYRNLPARRDIDVVRKHTGDQIVLVIADLLPLDAQHGHLVDDGLDRQRLRPVGRDRNMRHAVADRDRVDQLDVLAGDREGTLMELSPRFVTSATSPFLLMSSPEGCLPTSTVAIR